MDLQADFDDPFSDDRPIVTPGRAATQLHCPVPLPRGWRFVVDANEAASNHDGYPLPGARIRKIDAPGDYTVERVDGPGYDRSVVVERKSLPNLLGEVPTKKSREGSTAKLARARFEAALERMVDVRWPHLVVEASLPEVLKGGYTHTMVHPNSVVGSLVAWSMRFPVRVWFAGDRRHGQLLTEWLLAKAARELRDEERAAT